MKRLIKLSVIALALLGVANAPAPSPAVSIKNIQATNSLYLWMILQAEVNGQLGLAEATILKAYFQGRMDMGNIALSFLEP